MARGKSGLWLFAAAGALIALLLSRGGMVGQLAPEFSLVGAYGGRFYNESYKGKPVLLVFWTTSCGICRRELPILDRIALEYRRGPIEVIAVNVGDPQGARDFMREHQLRLTNTIDERAEVARRYKVGGVPKLVLIDGRGKVIREQTGAVSESVLRAWFRAASRS
jgi:methylamine dehydrogenase accessory protein MauD